MNGLIVAWAALHSDGQLHGALSLNDGGSVVTACRGRWSITEAFTIVRLDSPIIRALKHGYCEACFRVWLETKFIERGLRELVDNTQSIIAEQAKQFAHELERFNPTDRAGLEWFIGPCDHGQSPRSRCALGCAPGFTPRGNACSES